MSSDSYSGWTRRILAVGAGFGGVGVISYLAISSNEIALGALIAVVSTIITFYFTKEGVA